MLRGFPIPPVPLSRVGSSSAPRFSTISTRTDLAIQVPYTYLGPSPKYSTRTVSIHHIFRTPSAVHVIQLQRLYTHHTRRAIGLLFRTLVDSSDWYRRGMTFKPTRLLIRTLINPKTFQRSNTFRLTAIHRFITNCSALEHIPGFRGDLVHHPLSRSICAILPRLDRPKHQSP